MNDTVIRVENLSKSYRVGHLSARGSGGYETLREGVARGTRNFLRKAADMARGRQIVQGDEVEEFWALTDVNFEVKRGEVLGIVGRNGAGKSTLLKILSRITEPTNGRVTLLGRVASLLEVGTGFHPELTGRENIFLNGAILGMTQREVWRKFDEIVAFAEVEKFLDTPVKRYSSGMYVRLAFGVAAHLEPEILIVDEVLAVGDAQFQLKCLGKMQDVASKEGRTVLFVSHNLSAVRRLCVSGVLLENGVVVAAGAANEVADLYLKSAFDQKRNRFQLNGTGYTKVLLVDSAGLPISAVLPGKEAFIELGIRVVSGSDIHAGITIFNQIDVPLVLCASEHGGVVALKRGEYRFLVKVPTELLPPGIYRIEGAVWNADQVFHQDDYLGHFQVMTARAHDMHGRSSSAQYVSREQWIDLAYQRIVV
jgi:lipopolysaccharide transport system ATP-binding protein